MQKKIIDITLLITFHREGVLAHSTLNSIERCRQYAQAAGLHTEYVWVLDDCDAHTKQIILDHPAIKLSQVKIVEVQHQDLGASRNSGIAVAEGTAVAIFDGDDYFSTQWIERAWHYLHEFGLKSILHPEMVISFGSHSAYCWQVDQTERYFDKNALLYTNMWTSWNFAHRSVYEHCPYVMTRAFDTGFGHEDWQWNCETIALGYVHRLVPRTIGFYRRKRRSLVTAQVDVGAIIPSSQLFNQNIWLQGTSNAE